VRSSIPPQYLAYRMNFSCQIFSDSLYHPRYIAIRINVFGIFFSFA